MFLRRAFTIGCLLLCVVLFGSPLGCGRKQSADPKPALKPAPKASGPTIGFKFEAMPNVAIAVHNVYKEQEPSTVEVLKGWKVKYTALAVEDAETIRWLVDDKEIAKGVKEIEETKTDLGSFKVTLEAKDEMGAIVKFDRTVVVGEVFSESFMLETRGEYKKDKVYPHWVKRPTDLENGAMHWMGKVSRTAASPALTKFRWGYIQAMIGHTVDVKYHHVWTVRTKHTKAAQANVYKYYEFPQIPIANDTLALGQQRYWEKEADGDQELGKTLEQLDSPGVLGASETAEVVDVSEGTAIATYRITQPTLEKQKFRLWQVVFHVDTDHHIPIMEQEWEIEYDWSFAKI